MRRRWIAMGLGFSLLCGAAGLAIAASGVPVERRARIESLAPEQYTPAQKAMAAELAKHLPGSPRGPYSVLIRTPNIMEGALRLFSAYREESRLESRLMELMVLIVAHHWTAQYEWQIHAPIAVKAGIAPDVVEAIRLGHTPTLQREDEKLVYEIVNQLMTTRKLNPATYNKGIAMFGDDKMIELVSGAGYFAMLATTLVAFDVPGPQGSPERPLP